MAPAVTARWAALRESGAPVEPAELDALWALLEPVDALEILGQWRGFAFPTGHGIERVLRRSRWYGKRFVALDDARPLLCVGEDGELFSDVESGRGEASLWNVEFRGEVTATMVYDGMPVLDHFKRLDDRTLMGIMNGKPSVVLDGGRHFYFGLERD
ncbi:DUF4334 domain-containing protein [Frankia sp. CNm7]|uniref:DUF4334 domain-containing protein n=1 Tax=Frankia nepalensis TaxID=1836974 RepID=A0A937RG15_9ACTN|nr:DUF4334 domain-containing protein [Frankia nepalensis]MBL7511407.1 DUF4334 domain-containing protein [Frankia nepalensis]MBL7521760.1 DUF4334 domain-containing protein [Frankia nepalensis]MBL7631503.1 DUF4334 domain-containing protein [Frankia nepalensis]